MRYVSPQLYIYISLVFYDLCVMSLYIPSFLYSAFFWLYITTWIGITLLTAALCQVNKDKFAFAGPKHTEKGRLFLEVWKPKIFGVHHIFCFNTMRKNLEPFLSKFWICSPIGPCPVIFKPQLCATAIIDVVLASTTSIIGTLVEIFMTTYRRPP